VVASYVNLSLKIPGGKAASTPPYFQVEEGTAGTSSYVAKIIRKLGIPFRWEMPALCPHTVVKTLGTSRAHDSLLSR